MHVPNLVVRWLAKFLLERATLFSCPNLTSLHERSFFEACYEYRFKRQGTSPPEWVTSTFLPGWSELQAAITDLDKEILTFSRSEPYPTQN